MMDRYLPLSLRTLVLGQPVPVDLWNDRGVLLLARGHVIESEGFLRSLAAHRPMIKETDYAHWSQHPSGGVELVRAGGVRGTDPVRTGVPGSGLPVDLLSLVVPGAGVALDAVDLSLRLSKTLAALLRDSESRSDFLERLEAVHLVLERLAQEHTDDILFMLIQSLQDPAMVYCSSHALTAALVVRLVYAQSRDLMDQPLDSLAKAALTMNIGMFALHNELRVQRVPPDELQRRQINEHPYRSATLLRQQGVDDGAWLTLVEDHHETENGLGYPSAKRPHSSSLRVLQLADRFAAALTPRSYRSALPPLTAIRNIYNSVSSGDKGLGELLVKTIGLYPPGSYVRLANQETAVVVRRGQSARQPWVVSITSAQNIALAIPVLRDTRSPEFAVVAPVSPEVVRVRLDPARILKRV